MKLTLALAAIAAVASVSEAADLSAAIKNRLANMVEDQLAAEVEVEGVQNCKNKCDKMFNNMAYAILTQNPGGNTYEFRACIVGCTICNAQMDDKSNPSSGACLTACKDTDWLSAVDDQGVASPIVKGVIEPDKACQIGCIQDMCQGVCTGGTPDIKQTKANKALWWTGSANPNLGCSIKTGSVRPGGFYSQSGDYTWWNSAAGPGGVSSCCSNGMSLCQYVGNKNTKNYRDVIASAVRGCSDVPGAGKTKTSICAYVNAPQNCGNPA
jgi:hypothetical protein